MLDSFQVVCPKCDAVDRIPRKRPAPQAFCGEARPSSSRGTRSSSTGRGSGATSPPATRPCGELSSDSRHFPRPRRSKAPSLSGDLTRYMFCFSWCLGSSRACAWDRTSA